ncbi:MAG: DEAD/DEAH box helicase [Deltaproteobacteria bacterium]|nr:DEAD/DEAH box helicase [Deltaproteobacteria bacterium]
MNFDKFKLDTKIIAGIQAIGYSSPTPIQLEAIPHILEGRDLMGLAQTGTGKTAAFVLPVLQRLLTSARRSSVRVLIISPTRELTEQTHQTIAKLGKETKLKSTCIYGGMGMQPQITAVKRGVDIIAACPGRLLDHINKGTVCLSGIEVLVLDEADQMFEMGFLQDIKNIIKHLPKKRQTLLFSATMPDDIRELAKDVLHDPVTVQVGDTRPAPTVSHTFYPIEQGSKTALLKNILENTETGPVIVFTRTKRRSKTVAQQLEKSGFGATALHGDLTQGKRQKALDGFRNGIHKILVATDVAARGIDVRGISHVINYDIPDTALAYTHRIGRTGRAWDKGDAFTFVTGEDKYIERSITKTLGDEPKYCTIAGFNYSAPEVEQEAGRKHRSASRNNSGQSRRIKKSHGRARTGFPGSTGNRERIFID